MSAPEDDIEFIGAADATIGGVEVPAVYEVTQSGGGRKSQFLQETQSNGSSGAEKYGYTGGSGEQASEGDSGNESESDGGEETPPLELDIRAYIGDETYGALERLRETPADQETFTVEVGRVSLEDCELVDLQRSLAGETSGMYDARIIVREYREYEVIDTRVDWSALTNPDGQGSGADGGDGGSRFATPVREWVDENGDGVGDESGEELPEVQEQATLNEELGDGDTLENLHITEDGTHFLRASGTGWAVRNIGIEGVHSTSDPNYTWFAAEGDGIIENLYINETTSGTDAFGRTPGIFIPPSHDGTIIIRFCHIRGSSDAIYGSPPGNGDEHPNPGSGGRVIIENCYVEGAETAAYRLGTNGSYTRRSTAVDNNRAYWGYYNDTEAINSDFGGDVVAGDGNWATGQDATVTLQNTRVGGSTDLGPGEVNGDASGSPSTQQPANVPDSASAAANGRFYSLPPNEVTVTDPGSGGGTVGDQAFNTVSVAGGDHHDASIGSNETFENTIIDISANGASATISASGTNWAIRNVGFRGTQGTNGGDDNVDACNVRVSNGGTATIQNCYFGDGSVDGSMAAIQVDHSHAGTLNIGSVHAADWAHAGINANSCGWSRNSNWPNDPGWGVIHADNCYLHNCNVGGMLMPSTGSTLRNTTIVVDDHAPGRPLPNGSMGRDMNGVWVRADGRSQDEIRNCNILVTDALSERSPACVTAGEVDWSVPPYGGDVAIVNTQMRRQWANYRTLGTGNISTQGVGESPSNQPPSGVPMNAEQAASGGG